MDLIFKINKFMLSDKYKYVDMFIGLLFMVYFLYQYFINGDFSIILLVSGLLIFTLGITDITRKSLNRFFRSFLKEV